MGQKSSVFTRMLIIGGCELSLERNPIDNIDLIEFKNENQIQQIQQRLKIPSRGATAHVINNHLWIIGGCQGNKQHLNQIQILNLQLNQNSRQSDFFLLQNLKLEKERSCHMSAFSNKQKKLFIFGGFDGYECLNSVEMVDLQRLFKNELSDDELQQMEMKFEQLQKMPSRIKNGFCVMNEEDQCVYLIGGWDEKETMSSVFKFNTLTHEMNFDGFIPKQVEGHSCAYFPETQSIFIFGGFDSLGVTDRIMKYNLNSHSGSLVFGQKLSEPRENLVSQVINGDKIVVCSGWNGHASTNTIDIFHYDRETDSIKRIDNLNESQMQKYNISAEDKQILKNINIETVQKRNRPTSVVF